MRNETIIIKKEDLKENTKATFCGTKWSKRKTISKGEIAMMRECIEYMTQILEKANTGEIKVTDKDNGTQEINFYRTEADYNYNDPCNRNTYNEAFENVKYNREVEQKAIREQGDGSGCYTIEII